MSRLGSMLLVLALCLDPMASVRAENAGAATMFRNPALLDTTLWLPDRWPDARLRYRDENPQQFGDLRLPAAEAPPGGHPIVIFVHGGGWLSDWNKDYSSRFVEALTRAGFATWDIEFRRLGNDGGGYPGTFLDVAAGTDHLRVLARSYPLDLGRVVAVGHSSGGHLALWLAGRKNLPASSALRTDDPLPLAGVVSLAGVNDLERSLTLGDRRDVLDLLGVASQDAAGARFGETNPARLLPFGIPQVLIVGTLDSEWRITMTRDYAAAARAAGDDVELQEPDAANHFDVVDAEGPAARIVADAVRALVER